LGKSALSAWSRTFLNEVRRLTTADSIVYTSRTYAQNYVDADLAAFPLWIAVPNTTPGANTFNLGPWPRWALQQYSWTGQVPGIAGDVDMNAFSGNETQLQTLVLPPLTHTIGELKAIPDVVERGAGLRISARVTSSHARRLVLGATVFPAGSTTGGTSDPLYDRAVELPQGTANATRSFTLPAGLAPGDYDLVMALYLDLDDSGTINSGDLQVGSSRRKASALRVEATPGFATWAAAAGLDDVTGARAADPDHDGVENLMEYAFGTPPTRAQTESPMTVTIEPASDNPNARVLRLRFPRWPDRTDLVYSVQRTMNPADGDWITMASATGGVPFGGPGFQESGTAPVIVTLEIPVVATTPAYQRVGITPR
jgi:hypothetical protein